MSSDSHIDEPSQDAWAIDNVSLEGSGAASFAHTGMSMAVFLQR